MGKEHIQLLHGHFTTWCYFIVAITDHDVLEGIWNYPTENAVNITWLSNQIWPQ